MLVASVVPSLHTLLGLGLGLDLLKPSHLAPVFCSPAQGPEDQMSAPQESL